MIKVKLSKDEQQKIDIKINASKTIDGNIIIYEHPELDIVIVPSNNKVITIPKNFVTDELYDTQHRMFSYLRNKGVIIFDSIQGGNVYGSIEANYTKESEYGDPLQHLILTIAKYIEEDKPGIAFVKSIIDDDERDKVDPSADQTTELGEIPQEREKGDSKYNSRVLGWQNSFKIFQ